MTTITNNDFKNAIERKAYEQKESLAFVTILRNIYIYKEAGASMNDISKMIKLVQKTFGIENFTEIDAKIIAESVLQMIN